MPSLGRFLRQYLYPSATAVVVREVVYRRGNEALPAALYSPANQRGPLPAWVVLHGLTYHGRRHPSLDRLVRAIAASGAVVLVPEVSEWSSLQVAPGVTGASIVGGVDALLANADVIPERVGVFGFSFGATQALVASTDPHVRERTSSIVAWGGYADLYRLFHFGITGEHELDGEHYRVAPDPYGGWVMGANYLTRIPGHRRDQALADALRSLAEESGRRGTFAGDPSYDPLKLELRASLSPAQREVFDLLAPRKDSPDPDPEFAAQLSRALADAAIETDPLLDPTPFLPSIGQKVLIAHGRGDRLVPFTEALRLNRALPGAHVRGCTVTSLFAHSGGAGTSLGPIARGMEGIRFLNLLSRMLDLV